MKRIFSLALTVIFLLGVFAVPASSEDDTIQKITYELLDVLGGLEEDDNVSIYIWTADIDYKAVEDEVESITGFREESFQIDNDDFVLLMNFMSDSDEQMQEYLDATKDEREELSESVDSYIMTKREIACREYGELHEDFIENHLPNAEIFFISQYAPMIIAEISKSDAYRLKDVEQVTCLSLYTELEIVESGCLNISLPSIGAAYTRNTLGLRGNGIVIGMVEVGVPMNNVADLNYDNIVRPSSAERREHPSLVAAIMVGNRGVVPNERIAP
jgi:hypothetical protein